MSSYVANPGNCNFKHGLGAHYIFGIWKKMIARCTDPKDVRWNRYGARGIKVCDRWRLSITNFYTDMGERPSPKFSIDRIDNDGNYEPGNCRWADKKTQANNVSNNINIQYSGITRTLKEWSRELKFNYKRAHKRLKAGWSFEEIIKDAPTKRKLKLCKRGHEYGMNDTKINAKNGKAYRFCRQCARLMENKRE